MAAQRSAVGGSPIAVDTAARGNRLAGGAADELGGMLTGGVLTGGMLIGGELTATMLLLGNTGVVGAVGVGARDPCALPGTTDEHPATTANPRNTSSRRARIASAYG
jgi:hypothetical protein